MAAMAAVDTCKVVLLPSTSIKVETEFEEESELSFTSPVNSPGNESQVRFGDASDDDIYRILERNTPNTKKATKTAVKIFRDFLKEKGFETNFEGFDKACLNDALRKFYVEARKKDGDFYKKSALNSIRCALNRYLQTVRNCDIINDPEFRVSAEVFRAQGVELVRQGKGNAEQRADISVEDLKKLYFSDVMDINTAEGLLRKVFFDLMYLSSGSKRSRGTLREQTKETYAIGEDHYIKFIFINKDHLGMQNFSWRIYEKKGNPRCPVQTFAKYLSKLNPFNNCLWQRPKRDTQIEDSVWYDNSPLGHNTLGRMMETMSEEAHLSRIYSNHCLKGSNASVLDDQTLQNSMLLIKYQQPSNGLTFPKIVPKPSTTAPCTVSVIPCVPLASATLQQSTNAPQQTSQKVHITSSVLNNNPLIVTTWPDQVQTSPLNTPLHFTGSSAVAMTTPVMNQPILPTVVSVYSTCPSSQQQVKMSSPLTTHVLDTARGTPARQLPVKVFYEQGPTEWKQLASGATNGDGRVPNLLTQENFKPGRYKIVFDTETYFRSLAIDEYFYPYVEIVFIIKDPSQHYHVPLLLSPFGYSTYRGS